MTGSQHSIRTDGFKIVMAALQALFVRQLDPSELNPAEPVGRDDVTTYTSAFLSSVALGRGRGNERDIFVSCVNSFRELGEAELVNVRRFLDAEPNYRGMFTKDELFKRYVRFLDRVAIPAFGKTRGHKVELLKIGAPLSLGGLDLVGVDFNAVGVDVLMLDRAMLVGCAFKGRDRDSVWSDMSARHTRFIDCNFDKATINGGNFDQAVFQNTTAHGTTFINVFMNPTVISGLTCSSATQFIG